MADWNTPTLTDTYQNFLAYLKDRDVDLATLFDGGAPTNLPTGAIRWNSTNKRFEKWSGTAWAELEATYLINVDKLGGQQGAFYRDAGNLDAGILPAARFNDTAHGARSGGTLHTAASGAAAGFMSAADKTKLDGVEASANNYSHPTGAGNNHIPAGGASGDILRYSASGVAVWGAETVEIPPGTKMVFYQAAAPTGWTQITTQNDKALRVVSGAGGGGAGTHPLSSPPSTAHTHTGPSHTHTGPSHSHTVVDHAHTTANHTLTTAEMPAHSHDVYMWSNWAGSIVVEQVVNSTGVWRSGEISSTGGGGAHNHGNTGAAGAQATSADGTGATGAAGTGSTGANGPTAFAPAYIDVILCSRN